MTKIVTISKHAATATTVIVVNGELMTCVNTPDASVPSKLISSPNCDATTKRSAPIAIRRLPAGDEFIQPPA